MSQALTPDQLTDALERLPRWSLKDGKLHRSMNFGSFSEALAFIVRLGIEAEKSNHHPELFNVYSTVVVDLTTHDAGGITMFDIALAEAVDRLAGDA